jgi:S1-C subfamily serine protease
VTAGLAGGLITVAAVVVLALTGAFRGEPARDTGARARPDDALAVERLYERTRRSVAFVRATGGGAARSPFGGRRPRGSAATASGFLLDRDGTIVTSAHVVAGARAVTVQFNAGRPLPARLVGTDPATDLAVLRIDRAGAGTAPLRLAESDDLQAGQPVLALANPFGLSRTASPGVISAVQRRIPVAGEPPLDDVLQTDAAVSPRGCGGPLLDRRGRVIGVVSLVSPVAGEEPIAFAVPSDTVRRVVRRLSQQTG